MTAYLARVKAPHRPPMGIRWVWRRAIELENHTRRIMTRDTLSSNFLEHCSMRWIPLGLREGFFMQTDKIAGQDAFEIPQRIGNQTRIESTGITSRGEASTDRLRYVGKYNLMSVVRSE